MTNAIPQMDESELTMNDAPSMVWVKVRDVSDLIWEKNPKLHDLPSIIESVKIHGFQAVPKFDINLKSLSGAMGAIKDGNGRAEALATMENGGAFELPRGLAQEKGTGHWVMPVLIGTDAISVAMATSYALDANAIGLMASPNITAENIASLYDEEKYGSILQSLLEQSALPVSVPEDDFPQLGDMPPPVEQDEKGKNLPLLGIGADDPVHKVAKGETWSVGQHKLVCRHIVHEWRDWFNHLVEAAGATDNVPTLLITYPGPMVALSIRAQFVKLLMVQPDPWIAGHILDRYTDIHGEDSVSILEAASDDN